MLTTWRNWPLTALETSQFGHSSPWLIARNKMQKVTSVEIIFTGSGSWLPGFQIPVSILLYSKPASAPPICLGTFDFQLVGFQLCTELCFFLASDIFWSLFQFWPKEFKVSPSLSPCWRNGIQINEETRVKYRIEYNETSAILFMYEVLHIHRWWCNQLHKVWPPSTSCPYS